MASAIDNVITGLQTLRIDRAAQAVGHTGASAKVAVLNGTGFVAGRRVYDSVTGQWVTVVGAATVYLPATQIEEAQSVG